MRCTTIYIALLGAEILAMSVVAQPLQAPPAVTRTVVAAAKLPSVVETPLYLLIGMRHLGQSWTSPAQFVLGSAVMGRLLHWTNSALEWSFDQEGSRALQHS